MLALKEKCRISDNELDEAKKKLISAECSLNDMSRTGIALDQNEVVQVMVIMWIRTQKCTGTLGSDDPFPNLNFLQITIMSYFFLLNFYP